MPKTTYAIDLVGRYPTARLSVENHCGLWPVCGNTDGTLTPLYGYRLIGWCKAPFVRSSEWAIVFEKATPPDENIAGDQREMGVYWVHGDPKACRFTAGSTSFPDA